MWSPVPTWPSRRTFGGSGLSSHPAPPSRKRAPGRERGGAEEELLDARLAVGQAVAEEGEVAREARVGVDREVRLGVERVVDRHAVAGAERAVALDDGVAAAVGEDEVEARDELAERDRPASASTRASVAGASTSQNDARRPVQRRDGRLELGVEDADAARLDDEVGAGAPRTSSARAPRRRLPHDDLGPRRVVDVAVLLALVRVGLVERDLVAALGERADEAAVVRRRAVPVRRDERRPEERDPHAAASAAHGLEVADAELAQDREQLVDAVGARVAREDRPAAVPRERARELRRSARTSRSVRSISLAVARDEEVPARR